MSYKVLARKYRSQKFDEVVGQDPIAQTLKNAIKTNRVAHAYLFAGTRGVGKTTMARVLAKSLNCLSVDAPTTEPCCKCESCVAVNAGEDIDVIEIDGASNNSVEEVRRLRENAIYRPARSRYKIYIIDEVHMLSTSAFNALLKILEEPPSHVKFIFATTEPNKVIATIQSRCQRFNFNNISPNLIAEQLGSVLKQEKIKYQQDLILLLAKMANGSMRDGLSLLDRLISTGAETLTVDLLEEFLGYADSEKIYNLIGQIGDSNPAGALESIEDLINKGLSEAQIVDSLIDYMRDLMVVKSTGVESELLILTAEQRKRAGELAEKFDTAALIYNITALEKLRWTLKNSDTARALLEASILRLALSEHFLNVDTLLSQLENTSGRTLKKNKVVDHKPAKSTSASGKKPTIDKLPNLPRLENLQSIKDNWQRVLAIISEKLGMGTGGLLKQAEPVSFENGLLRLRFGTSAEVSKRMCESNGRSEAIQSVLRQCCNKEIRLKFECSDQTQIGRDETKTVTQNKNELINDPAVKTVLMGLDATITRIDKNNRS